ncbi:MAG: hypothetical protein EDR02_00095 [Actinobacteria bacterium]|nr:MAG: hypothetical protein EDR02_00095 [Actinomycetota bacterium]RIK03825.1 MAG: hypothetical protein DCC48_15470 [Acidobacteriota bacterium]
MKAGTRLRSAVCETEVMVVSAPEGAVQITCGGAPMIGMDDEAPHGLTLSSDAARGTLLGKRYVTNTGDLEVLCTKPGEGSVAADGEILEVKEAKPLPSSD